MIIEIVEDKISADQRINIIPSENTLKIVCQLMRVMDLPSGHMLIYGRKNFTNPI